MDPLSSKYLEEILRKWWGWWVVSHQMKLVPLYTRTDRFTWFLTCNTVYTHRWRINTEEKFSGWGGEFMKFLAPLVVLLLDNDELHQDDLKKRTNSSYSSKSAKCKIVSAARNWNNVSPKHKRRPLPFLLYSSFFYEYTSRALMG